MRQVSSLVGGERGRKRQPVTLEDLRAFEELLRSNYPKLRIAFKDESALQRVLGYVMFPFNPGFMTRYVSTFAPVVYFPSKEFYESNPKGSVTLLAHEYVHLLDTERQPFWFRFSYLFPQVLAPVALAVYVGLARTHSWPLAVLLTGALLSALIARVSMAAFFVSLVLVLGGSAFLAVHFSGWSSVALGVALLLLAPWPSAGRVRLERRGYAMSLALYCWTLGYVPQILRDSVARMFTGPAYYFMSWSKKSTDSFVNTAVAQASSGELAKEPPYGLVYDFLHKRGLVK